MKNSDRYLSLFLELLWRRQCERLDEALDDAYDEFLESLWYRLTPEERREVETTFDRLKIVQGIAGDGAYEPVLHRGDHTPPHVMRAA